MPVSLKIISFKGHAYDHAESVLIGKDGGSIGRQGNCDLVLEDKDKIVSRHHATISCSNNQYILSDSSLAGTYVNDSQEPINNVSVELVDGMLLRIGDYQIQVSVLPEPETDSMPLPVDPIMPSAIVENEINPFGEENVLLDFPGNDDQSADLLSENPLIMEQDNPFLTDHQEPYVPSTDHQEQFSSLHDSFIPPSPAEVSQADDVIPEDFNFEELFNLAPSATDPLSTTESSRAESTQEAEHLASLNPVDPALTNPPSPLTAIPEAGMGTLHDKDIETPVRLSERHTEDLLNAFLQGAGVQSSQQLTEQSENCMRNIGTMFRQFVENTVAVLRNRSEFKSLFRVTVTTIRKTDNNPLKFSVTTDEALQHLLNDGQSGFKKSVEAIDEGFQDILNHQLAMQAGIQASLMEILRQFEPDRIEAQFEEGLVLNKKAKCWDRFHEIYRRLAETAVEDFYGETFADAYELQMKQITAIKNKK